MIQKTVQFDQHSIEQTFHLAQSCLFNAANIHPIHYENGDPATFDRLNQSLLTDLAGRNLVYCLWSGSSPEALDFHYIGQVKGRHARQRIRNHLCRKHARTGAQLKKVEAVLAGKGAIGLSFVEVAPSYMRCALEEWLINRHQKQLNWNIAGKTISASTD